MEQRIKQIFEGITEHFSIPMRLSSRCETEVYYHVENLSQEDLQLCAAYIGERVRNVCHPNMPTILISLSGSYTDLAETLSIELGQSDKPLEIVALQDLDAGNGVVSRLKHSRSVLVNDVITTARSCLKAHTRITMLGSTVLCWAALIDRTFGPGPVPVVAAYTGAAVRLLEELP